MRYSYSNRVTVKLLLTIRIILCYSIPMVKKISASIILKKRLGDIATIQVGYTFRSRIETDPTGNALVIQMKDIRDDGIVSSDTLTRTHVNDLKNNQLAFCDDIIFRSRGQNNTAGIICNNITNAIVAAPLIRMRIIKPIAYPRYIMWFINQPSSQKMLASNAKGTGQQMISKKDLEQLEIIIPSIEQQKQIVEISLLEEKEQSLLNLLSTKKAVFISKKLMQHAKGESNHGNK